MLNRKSKNRQEASVRKENVAKKVWRVDRRVRNIYGKGSMNNRRTITPRPRGYPVHLF